MATNLKDQLMEVFGGGGQVAPGGTAAILVRPSTIDMELAAQVVKRTSMDRVCRDLGAVAAREVADELQRQGLKPADFATLEDLPQVVAKRIAVRLLRSEEFSRSFLQHLGMRG